MSDLEHAQTALFALLLKGYTLAAARSPRPSAARADRYERFLRAFTEAHGRAVVREGARAARRAGTFARLFQGHRVAIDLWQERQSEAADDFDLLEVLGLTRNEVRHTRMLAWLLDRNGRRLGTHAQGNLGFRLLLAELGLPVGFADRPYWVRREVAGDESRVDIEVAARGQFLIHIEAKIRAREGLLQTDREWSDLCRRAEALGIPEDARVHCVFPLFLTPNGDPAGNPEFRAVSWRRIALVLDRFAEKARPPAVKLFAAHYARSLRRFVFTEVQRDDENTHG